MLLTVKILQELHAKENDSGSILHLQLLKDGEPFSLYKNYNLEDLRVVLSNGKCLVKNSTPNGVNFVDGILQINLGNIGAGTFKGEIIVDNGTKHYTFPNDGYFTFRVLPNIENMEFETVSKELYDELLAKIAELQG